MLLKPIMMNPMIDLIIYRVYKRTLLLSLLMTGLVPEAFTQSAADSTKPVEVDIIKVGYAQSLNADSGKSQYDAYVSLLLPIPINDNFVLITGVSYNNLTTKVFGSAAQFYKLTIPLGFKANLSELNTITVVALNRVTKNIQPNLAAKYQSGGIFIYTRKVSERFKYNIGLYYNTEESGAFFIPVIGTKWNPTDKWEVKGNMPINLRISYAPVKPLKIGVSYVGKYESYDLGNTYMVINRNEFAFFVETATFKNLIVQAGLAYNLSNTSKVYLSSDRVEASIIGFHLNDSRNIISNTQLSNTFFLDLKLIYRIFK
ncbi:MAG: hypothetical protein COB85_06710 [Bacteroidetes bacterium]|nr:MAG: hypothetical protein COB85_06710 [Bacteroidota bacterium]